MVARVSFLVAVVGETGGETVGSVEDTLLVGAEVSVLAFSFRLNARNCC